MPNEINLRADGSIDQTIFDFGKAFIAATISSGAITFTESMVTVDTEASAATDDLNTIINGGTGKALFLRCTTATRAVVLKHLTGNIWTGGSDITLNDPQRIALLIYDGQYWVLMNSGLSTALTETTNPIDPSDIDPGEDVSCVAAARAAAFVESVIVAAKAVITSNVSMVATEIIDAIRVVVEPSRAACINLATGLKAAYANEAAVDADFTSGVYDTLEELIFVADVNEDGLYSASEIAILVTSLDAESGDAYAYLADLVSILGSTGLSNSTALNTDIVSNDCSGYNRLISVEFSATTSEALEGDTHIITVVLNTTSALGSSVSVNVGVTGGSASSSDYTLNTTTVTFTAGATNGATQNVSIDIEPDADLEAEETIVLTLSSPTGGAVLGTNYQHTITLEAEWCYEFDFASSNGGWTAHVTINGTQAAYSAGNGSQPTITLASRISIDKTFTSAYLTSIQVFRSQAISGQQVIYDGNANGSGFYTTPLGTADGSDLDAIYSLNMILDKISVDVQGNTDISGEVERIIIRGAGANPFGTSNC